MAKVAFIGLGVMGFPMAGHLVAKGHHDVTVYNRTADKAQAWAKKFGGRTPMKRPAQPEEIAPAFVFLAAPSCSSYITGEVLPIIGGYSGG